MKRINSSSVGIQQGSQIVFSDFLDQGHMWCGQGHREERACVMFSEPFLDKPAVHLSISMVDIDHKHNLRTDLSATDITNTSFVVVFRTWSDTRIARLRVDWLAIGPTIADDDWQLY
jgi:hypothetical protein